MTERTKDSEGGQPGHILSSAGSEAELVPLVSRGALTPAGRKCWGIQVWLYLCTSGSPGWSRLLLVQHKTGRQEQEQTRKVLQEFTCSQHGGSRTSVAASPFTSSPLHGSMARSESACSRNHVTGRLPGAQGRDSELELTSEHQWATSWNFVP